jgi:AcrR family transcriptional regulator
MPRGRTRDLAAHDRILDATFELLSSPNRSAIRIDDIAEAANVGKQTIYRWWPSRESVAMAALLRGTLSATPFPDTGSTHDDFETHLRLVAELFASPVGALIRGVVGDAQDSPTSAADFLSGFWAPRRVLSVACLARGIARGDVRPDVDVELVLDALYGPLWTRLLLGHQPVTPEFAAAILGLVWPQVRRLQPRCTG